MAESYESQILWYLSHGYSNIDAGELVRSHFPQATDEDIERGLALSQSWMRGGADFEKADLDTKIGELIGYNFAGPLDVIANIKINCIDQYGYLFESFAIWEGDASASVEEVTQWAINAAAEPSGKKFYVSDSKQTCEEVDSLEVVSILPA